MLLKFTISVLREGNVLPADKEFKSVYDQIRLLRTRNLHINDVVSAKKNLLSKNYFNLINGFESLLLDDPQNSSKKYTKKSFNDFVRLHDFDSQLSSIILQKISEFETKLKTSIAYHFCKHHCSTLPNNSKYIDVNCYDIPGKTDGPKQYVSYFYKGDNDKSTHKMFRKNYFFDGKFRGTFSGTVKYLPDDVTPVKTVLEGIFKGRFGSTSIREVDGKLTFYNNRQPRLFTELRLITTTSGSTVSTRINLRKDEKIYGLTYIDSCKINFPYINEYNNPPFWVVIKTLMLNDVIILMYGLKKRTIDAVLRDFNLKPYEKEGFLNSLEIIRDLRNTCAHFDLVSHFKTSQKLKIDAGLIVKLSLTPMRSHYIIKLYDVLRVLGLYIDLFEVKSFIHNYWYLEKKSNSISIAESLLDRMGNKNINDWI